MLHADMHGPWASTAAGRIESLHRQLCLEMLEQLAAGGSAPYPYGDAVYLLDAMRPRAVQATPVRDGGLIRRVARFLTSPWPRHSMKPRSGEAVGGDGRSRVSDGPVRGVSA